MTESEKNKRYRKMQEFEALIANFPLTGRTKVFFTGTLYRNGKEVATLEKCPVEHFDSVVRNALAGDEPDLVCIEFIDGDTGDVFRTKEVTLKVNPRKQKEEQKPEPVTAVVPVHTVPPGYIGLGEVDAIVTRKVENMEQQRLYNQAVSDVNTLTEKVSRLEDEKRTLESSIAAKDNMEFYSKIIGMALPGLSTFLTNTAIGPAISMLAGTGGEQGNNGQQQVQETDERTSMTNMIAEFCHQLTEQELASVYLVLAEMERDRSNIQRVLQFISQNKQ